MPVKRVPPRSAYASDKPVLKFTLVGEQGLEPSEQTARAALSVRIECLRYYEEMTKLQAEFATNREYAKFFKEERAWAKKLYASACLVVSWVCWTSPGDCKLSDPFEWPDEYFSALEFVIGRIECVAKAA